MNCDKFINNISLYIDNELSDIEIREFELHLMKCDSCRTEYENMISIIMILREEDQVELPGEYRASLKEKLIAASNEQKRKVNWKYLASIAATLLIFFTSYELISNNNIFSLNKSEQGIERGYDVDTQKGSTNSDDTMIMARGSITEESGKEMSEETTFSETELEGAMPQDSIHDTNVNVDDNFVEGSSSFTIASENLNQLREDSNVNGLQASRSMMTNRKTIKEAYIDITVTEIDDRLNEIIDYVKANNGFVESMNIDEIHSDISSQSIPKRQVIKIRISQEKFEDVVNYIKIMGLINSSQCSIMDVTDSYDSINDSLTQLYEKETRLKEIFTRLEDEKDKMIIEEEILEVKNQIESYNITLQDMQDSSNLSTINVTIIEDKNESEDVNEDSNN